MKKKYLTLKQKLQGTLERGSTFSIWRNLPRGESFSTNAYNYKDTDTVITTATLNESVAEFRKLVIRGNSSEFSKNASNSFLLRFLRSADMNAKDALTTWRAYWKLYRQLRLSYSLQPVNILVQKTGSFRSTISKKSGKSGKSAHFERSVMLEVPTVVNCLASGWIQSPPARDVDGRQIVYIYPNLFDREIYSGADVYATLFNLTNTLLASVHTQQNGFCVVFDLINTKIRNLPVDEVKNTILVILNCLPIKVGQLLILGYPSYAKVLWRSTQKSLSQELRNNTKLIQGRNDQEIGFELEEFIDESQRLKKYDGTLEWDVEKSMKEWVLNEMML